MPDETRTLRERVDEIVRRLKLNPTDPKAGHDIVEVSEGRLRAYLNSLLSPVGRAPEEGEREADLEGAWRCEGCGAYFTEYQENPDCGGAAPLVRVAAPSPEPRAEWLRKMTVAEDEAGSISVGGLAADAGFPVRPGDAADVLVRTELCKGCGKTTEVWTDSKRCLHCGKVSPEPRATPAVPEGLALRSAEAAQWGHTWTLEDHDMVVAFLRRIEERRANLLQSCDDRGVALERAESALAAALTTPTGTAAATYEPFKFWCPDCIGTCKADEDGCCTVCGTDTETLYRATGTAEPRAVEGEAVCDCGHRSISHASEQLGVCVECNCPEFRIAAPRPESEPGTKGAEGDG